MMKARLSTTTSLGRNKFTSSSLQQALTSICLSGKDSPNSSIPLQWMSSSIQKSLERAIMKVRKRRANLRETSCLLGLAQVYLITRWTMK